MNVIHIDNINYFATNKNAHTIAIKWNKNKINTKIKKNIQNY